MHFVVCILMSLSQTTKTKKFALLVIFTNNGDWRATTNKSLRNNANNHTPFISRPSRTLKNFFQYFWNSFSFSACINIKNKNLAVSALCMQYGYRGPRNSREEIISQVISVISFNCCLITCIVIQFVDSQFSLSSFLCSII